MTTWNEGYVTDISYDGGFYREQTPAHLDAACLVAGIAPPVPQGAPFTYCELGFGLGDTALAVAAGNPQARVWGFDFNPAHVAAARAVAARTGIVNIALAERSFEDLAASPPADLPPFDYVTLHGVWSWVSPANQANIVAFLRSHLRPGGLACISYNAMPGWAPYVGLQRLLYEAGQAGDGGSDRRIREALVLVRRLADAGCGALDDRSVKDLETRLERGQASYLAHEYLNEDWRPAFHSEVAEAMAGAKLTYAASADMFDNLPQLCMRPEQAAVVASLPPELHRTAEDAFRRRAFRRDIYVRGPRLLLGRARAERAGAQRVISLARPGSASLKVAIPAGEATLSEAFYGPAVAALSRGGLSVADLHAAAAPGTAPAQEEILGMLIGGRLAIPAPNEPDAAALEAARRFNRARFALYVEEEQQSGWLVGARIGSALPVGIDEMLVYEAIADAEDRGEAIEETGKAVAALVRELMLARGMSLLVAESGRAPDIDAHVREILALRVPIWRAAGAL